MYDVLNSTWHGLPALVLTQKDVLVWVLRDEPKVVSVLVGGRELLAQSADLGQVTDLPGGATLALQGWQVDSWMPHTRATLGHAAVIGQLALTREVDEGRETRAVEVRIELARGRLRLVARLVAESPAVQRAHVGWTLAFRLDTPERWRVILPQGVNSRPVGDGRSHAAWALRSTWRVPDLPAWLWLAPDDVGEDVVLTDDDRLWLGLRLEHGLAGVDVHRPHGTTALVMSCPTATIEDSAPFAAPLHETAVTLDLGLPDPDDQAEAHIGLALAGAPDAPPLVAFVGLHPEHHAMLRRLLEHVGATGLAGASPLLLAGFAAAHPAEQLRAFATRAWQYGVLGDDWQAIALGMDPLDVALARPAMLAWIARDAEVVKERCDTVRRLARHAALAEAELQRLTVHHVVEFGLVDLRELGLEAAAAHWKLCAELLAALPSSAPTADAAKKLAHELRTSTHLSLPLRETLEQIVLG